MKKITFGSDKADPIELFNSSSASSVEFGKGSGEIHAYCIHFKESGEIGFHRAGFDQLFLVTQGKGWVVGSDGEKIMLETGEGVFLEKGERHSKGINGNMTAIMIQADSINLSNKN